MRRRPPRRQSGRAVITSYSIHYTKLYETGSEVGDAVHLLGVAGDHLIASGYRLYWISLRREDAGHVERMFPDSAEKLGHGRGVLAGDEVWWPTRDRITSYNVCYTKLLRSAIRP